MIEVRRWRRYRKADKESCAFRIIYLTESLPSDVVGEILFSSLCVIDADLLPSLWWNTLMLIINSLLISPLFDQFDDSVLGIELLSYIESYSILRASFFAASQRRPVLLNNIISHCENICPNEICKSSLKWHAFFIVVNFFRLLITVEMDQF